MLPHVHFDAPQMHVCMERALLSSWHDVYSTSSLPRCANPCPAHFGGRRRLPSVLRRSNLSPPYSLPPFCLASLPSRTLSTLEQAARSQTWHWLLRRQLLPDLGLWIAASWVEAVVCSRCYFASFSSSPPSRPSVLILRDSTPPVYRRYEQRHLGGCAPVRRRGTCSNGKQDIM